MTEKELLKLKQQIDDAKQSSSELRGQLTALIGQLKDDWKCDNVKEAEALLKKYDDDIAEYNRKIDTGFKELSEIYEYE